VISLPIYPSLSEEAIDRVARVIERLATGPAEK
jgi:dTDP-4-amino-4,6-dideoxygalactose transaminase